MIQIRDEDVEYALDEARSMDKDFSLLLAWENELIKNSPEFWVYFYKKVEVATAIIRRNRKSTREILHPRYILTLVFATVYSAKSGTLPRLSMSEVKRLHELYKGTMPEEEVLKTMRGMHVGWGITMGEFIKGYDDESHANYVIFLLAETLFDALEREEGDDDFDISAALVPSAPSKPVTTKKIAKNSDGKANQKSEPTSSPVTFADIGGQQKAKLEVMKLAAALNKPERYKRWGTRPPRGIALVGPPGNGKTLLARALASEAKVPFFNVNITDIMSAFINKSAQGITKVFEDARKAGGGVIFFDEFDALAPTRSNIHTHQEDRKVVGALNRQMDGFTPADRIVVFVATNRVEDIDSAVMRPGRIDRIIEVPLPDQDGRKEILAVHCKHAENEAGRALFETLDVMRINEKMQGFSGADIAEIIRRVLEVKVIEEDKGKVPGLVTSEEMLRELGAYERVKEVTRKIGFSAQGGSA